MHVSHIQYKTLSELEQIILGARRFHYFQDSEIALRGKDKENDHSATHQSISPEEERQRCHTKIIDNNPIYSRPESNLELHV